MIMMLRGIWPMRPLRCNHDDDGGDRRRCRIPLPGAQAVVRKQQACVRGRDPPLASATASPGDRGSSSAAGGGEEAREAAGGPPSRWQAREAVLVLPSEDTPVSVCAVLRDHAFVLCYVVGSSRFHLLVEPVAWQAGTERDGVVTVGPARRVPRSCRDSSTQTELLGEEAGPSRRRSRSPAPRSNRPRR